MPMYMYLGFHTWGEPPLDPLKSRRVARPAADSPVASSWVALVKATGHFEINKVLYIYIPMYRFMIYR